MSNMTEIQASAITILSLANAEGVNVTLGTHGIEDDFRKVEFDKKDTIDELIDKLKKV